MKGLDLFCGAGGFSYGMAQSGIQVIAGIEWEKSCKQTFEYNHPGTEFICADIRNLNPHDWVGKEIDVIFGSPPCTEFSGANKAGNPELGMELVNTFLNWVKIIKPKYWILENVPRVQKYLPSNIYINSRVLNALQYGVPQRRMRLFAGKYTYPQRTQRLPITLQEVLDVPSGIPNNEEIPITNGAIHAAYESKYGKERKWSYQKLDQPSYTICAQDYAVIHIGDKLHILTARQRARIMGFPDSFIFFGSTTQQIKMIGNAVCPPVARALGKALQAPSIITI